MPFADRLRELRIRKNMTQGELSKATGLTQSAIAMYETGKREPKIEVMELLADYFNVDMNYITGKTDKTTILSASPTFPIKTAAMVPIIGSVRCGPGGPAYEYIDEYVSIDDSYRKPDEIRGFRAVGDSMEGDEIHDGDLCLVHLQEEVEDGALAVVVIDGEEGTLKRIRRQPGMILLEASNPAYKTRVFAGEEANTIRIVGKVVEVRHKK